MFAATTHGLWPRELNVQEREFTVQVAVTLIPATAKVEKKNKDTRGAATWRTRKDILV
jgi:hypothetical protein